MVQCTSIFSYFQPPDEKDAEEEGATKVIPKWKASHITEIILEPEPEEEEEEEKAEEVEGAPTTGEGTADGK